MSETQIWKLNLSSGDFSFAGDNWSTAWGGADSPVAGYPEFGHIENVQRVEGAGASGQHVIDAVTTTNYAVSWINFCGIGPLTNGQWDARGGGVGQPLKCRWKQFLNSNALAENGFCCALMLANGGNGGAESGLFSANTFFQLNMNQTAGANFTWEALYKKRNGIGPFLGFNFASVAGSADVADNAEHTIIVTMVPGTVTGAWNGSGSQGSGTIASDGSFDVSVDGVSVVAASGIEFVINSRSASNPEVYYGKTIWHGD